MATVTPGRTWATGSTVAVSTPTVIFRSDKAAKDAPGTSYGPPFRVVSFDVASASAAPLKVNIPAIHGTSYFPIPVGLSKEFTVLGGDARDPAGHIITVDGDGGTATFSGGITA